MKEQKKQEMLQKRAERKAKQEKRALEKAEQLKLD